MGRRHEIDGARRCARCGQLKAVEVGFGSHHWCKTCCRLYQGEYRRTPAYREWLKAYCQRPERKARQREARVKLGRTEEQKARAKAYRQTAHGRILDCLTHARIKARRATSEKVRLGAERLIAAYTVELARMDARPKEVSS